MYGIIVRFFIGESMKDLEELIQEKEKELYELKKEYREKKTAGLKSAMEAKREAERMIREEMKALGYISKDNDSWNSTLRWYNF